MKSWRPWTSLDRDHKTPLGFSLKGLWQAQQRHDTQGTWYTRELKIANCEFQRRSETGPKEEMGELLMSLFKNTALMTSHK